MKLAASQEAVNLSWQHSLRSVWESIGAGSGNGAARGGGAVNGSTAIRGPAAALPLQPLPAVASPGLPAAAALAVAQGGTPRSAVLPSLQVTLDWLQRCVREVPTMRMQVLVSGSLYLVGDLLKVLQQQQPPPQPLQANGAGSSGISGSSGGSSPGAAG